jgi:hypothetical protein
MSDADSIPTTVELLTRIEASWAQVDDAIADLDDHQLSTPPAEGAWSIKDHLAHLATWMISAAALVAGENRPDAMGVSRSTWSEGDEEGLNAEIQSRWGARSAGEVVAAYRTAQTRLRDLVSAMSDDDLVRPYSHFQPADGGHNANPVIGWIAGNTFGHVEMHLPDMLDARRRVA